MTSHDSWGRPWGRPPPPAPLAGLKGELESLRASLRDEVSRAVARAVAGAVAGAVASALAGGMAPVPHFAAPRFAAPAGRQDEHRRPAWGRTGLEDRREEDERLGWGGFEDDRYEDDRLDDEYEGGRYERRPTPAVRPEALRQLLAGCCEAAAWLVWRSAPPTPAGALAVGVAAALAFLLGGSLGPGLALAGLADAVVAGDRLIAGSAAD